MLFLSITAVIFIILVHLFASNIKFFDVIPRSRWLSFSGGVSVAYVFIHLLPELAAGQKHIADSLKGTLKFIDNHIYIIALIGLTAFYGLERMAKSSREKSNSKLAEMRENNKIFWIHISSYAIYNFLIGYLLLHLEEETLRGVVFYAFAMAFHFLVNDFGLRKEHGQLYSKKGRWIISGVILIGFLIGLLFEFSELVTVIIMSFLAGGIILNVLKEELPEERKSRFGAFLSGAVFYSALLLLSN